MLQFNTMQYKHQKYESYNWTQKITIPTLCNRTMDFHKDSVEVLVNFKFDSLWKVGANKAGAINCNDVIVDSQTTVTGNTTVRLNTLNH